MLKSPTGIPGFDRMTSGGLPKGRTTLLVGGPGSGKTIFAAQFLVHGARVCREPGIFVAFEESPKRIVANFEGFGWDIRSLQKNKLFFLDAHPTPDLVQSGNFDISGMLASLGAKAKEMRARRIVFDAIDVLLALLSDQAAVRLEMHRLHRWLIDNQFTALITAKIREDVRDAGLQAFSFMQFMVDCSVVLNHRVDHGVSQRDLRVQKHRGSSYNEDETPFVISKTGFNVAISRALAMSRSA